MKRINKQHFTEQVIYFVLWLIVFLVPIVGGYYGALTDTNFNFSWSTVGMVWLLMLPFLLLFVLNNYVLAPCLLLRKKYLAYSLSVLAVIVLLFMLYPSWDSPHRKKEFAQEISFLHDKMERRMHRAPDAFRERKPLLMPAPPALIRFMLAVLLVGFNIAIKLMFKSLKDEQTLKELEHECLQAELEYLKYQINPHFFMNTLNNIHALVDIDTAQAQRAIIEFSKLMRYVLYEANNPTISLQREIQFLNNYIELMKLRYTSKVRIDARFPGELPDAQIPPLLFISFVENAFKHGVSYRNDSFISISVELETDRLIFHCVNSNWKRMDETHPGIGLENIRKRLRLLYGNDYTLSVDETRERYAVLLIIPFV